MIESGIPLSEVTFQNTVIGATGSPEHRYYDKSRGEKPHRQARLFLVPSGVILIQEPVDKRKGPFVKGVASANVREWTPL